jgi:tRNA/tmRNA/rRNA uracil-C5-methylase (TrmA/RlmC/RlmD family)
MNVGDEVVVDISGIAHGGHCVSRFEGRVIFVRHAIPGEKVRVRITDISKSFARADCIEVLTASVDRVKPPCSYAHPGGCGGCDFQHISLVAQRKLKAEIIKEQFARLAKLNIEIQVEEVKPTLGWRSRMEFTISSGGKLAMFESRRNNLIEISDCKIADPRIDIATINSRKLPLGKKIDVAVGTTGEVVTSIEGRDNFSLIKQEVAGFEFSISPDSFWQSHTQAPLTLLSVVMEMSALRLGDHFYDLYSGVGLFASGALSLVGAGGRITMIEESGSSVTDARRNFASYERVEVIEGKVERELSKFVRADVVVLDPPRAGAGERVIKAISALNPRTIVYVACDPASLARDAAILQARGYELDAIRAFDLFPMTQHIESVARFIKSI